MQAGSGTSSWLGGTSCTGEAGGQKGREPWLSGTWEIFTTPAGLGNPPSSAFSWETGVVGERVDIKSPRISGTNTGSGTSFLRGQSSIGAEGGWLLVADRDEDEVTLELHGRSSCILLIDFWRAQKRLDARRPMRWHDGLAPPQWVASWSGWRRSRPAQEARWYMPDGPQFEDLCGLRLRPRISPGTEGNTLEPQRLPDGGQHNVPWRHVYHWSTGRRHW